ncbi:MAG: efflux transporter periplasmic adaptor subunit [Candidatus Pelagibacter sp.]|nr:efflux transporter periplasmic adaptor subunit [Candidatus Pelagibacter sp.]OUV86960.1 MAG: efflux transporter periplasmic adaptor subunit [Pelagibacteraceae bacterium TMED136]|tara:strand:- start:5436 stop:6308 length:873 start_codon:yes stop_codon:yes gene_type:complete
MKTKNKIIVYLSIFFLIIASIIIGRAFINSKIDDAIKKARNRPIEVVSHTVIESDFFQNIETFGTAIANRSFSIRIKKENIIKSIDFNKQQIIKKGTIIATLKDRNIIAPFEGRLGKREITPGILGNNNSIIATLDDSTKLKVDIKLPENYVGILKNGLKVQATSDAFNKIFSGEVKTVSSRVDPTSRSILAQIEILNPNLDLIPGILLNIKVIYDERKSISIPEESLILQGDNKFVYLIDNNVLKRKNIKIGIRNFGKVEVLSGLKIGDNIVAEGTNKVRNKARVKIKK